MDPEKRSPLDAWASKHMSIASAASMDILGELPPPPPPKSSRPSSAGANAAGTATAPTPKKRIARPTKELPPLPPTPREAAQVFDFKPPSIGSVQSHRAVVSPAPVQVARSPPQRFDFESLDDHLKMGIYQIEAGSLEWARVHINHARARSLIGRLLWDVGGQVGWWARDPARFFTQSFDYLDDIDLPRLRRLAGTLPAPRLAGAFSSLARFNDLFNSAAVLMEVPMPEFPQRRGSIGKAAKAAALSSSSEPILVAAPALPKAPLMMPRSSSRGSLRTRTPEPRLSDVPMPTTPKPFARTHGHSDSNQSLNSAHMFPYPWRHSRNNSQTSSSG